MRLQAEQTVLFTCLTRGPFDPGSKQSVTRFSMAPKSRFPLTDIVDAALSVVRRNGLEHLTARAVANELNSSTMPIYSCGRTMAEIEADVVKRCWEILVLYQKRPTTQDIYINMGLGYVLFAKHEKHLFGCIHNPRHLELNRHFAAENFLFNINRLKDYPPLADISDDLKLKILIQGWIFCHGLADLLSRTPVNLETDEEITAFIVESNRIVHSGIKHVMADSMKDREKSQNSNET